MTHFSVTCIYYSTKHFFFFGGEHVICIQFIITTFKFESSKIYYVFTKIMFLKFISFFFGETKIHFKCKRHNLTKILRNSNVFSWVFFCLLLNFHFNFMNEHFDHLVLEAYCAIYQEKKS